jgi:CRISPR-associated protein Cmr4
MKTKLTFIHVLSPLHAGTGQGVGVIDLPIAREKATNIPYLPGSSVKGTIRDEFNGEPNQNQIFGPEDASYAGAIQFTDQTLLCLPVRSLAGTFAYVTSPYILKRLKRDANLSLQAPTVTDTNALTKCIVTGDTLKLSDKVCLEDLDVTPEPTPDTTWASWLKNKVFVDTAWQDFFAERFCIVSDNVFGFLLNTATEVIARNVLTENKTSDNLWYEEALPTESLLFGLALSFPNSATGMDDAAIFQAISTKIKKPLQFGGNATVGRGLCQVELF